MLTFFKNSFQNLFAIFLGSKNWFAIVVISFIFCLELCKINTPEGIVQSLIKIGLRTLDQILNFLWKLLPIKWKFSRKLHAL